MIYYRADFIGARIELVTVLIVTPRQVHFVDSYGSVVVNKKRGKHVAYFETWDQAREWLQEQAQDAVMLARDVLERAKGKEERIRNLVKP